MGAAQMLFGFEGRIRRTHYWLWGVGSAIVYGMILTMVMLLGGGSGLWMHYGGGWPASGLTGVWLIVYLVAFLAAVWTGLAMQVKRWHDRDKSGVWVLINFIPLIGGLWTLVECGFIDGTLGPNRYGASPKGIGGPSTAVA